MLVIVAVKCQLKSGIPLNIQNETKNLYKITDSYGTSSTKKISIYDWFNIFNQRIQKESVRPSKTSGKSDEIRIGKKAYNKAHGLKVWLSTSLVHLIVSRKLGKFVPVGYPEFLRLNTNS